jgi:CRP-like cAMP-binding protein
VVFRKGDPGDDLYVVLRGKIAIRDGKLEVATMGPREFFGELSIIDHEPRSADAIVSEDAQLLRLRSSDLGELMAQRPQIQEQFLIVLARRLRAVTQRVSMQ